jgi:hypothetical protein
MARYIIYCLWNWYYIPPVIYYNVYFKEIIVADSVSSGSGGGENVTKCFQDCHILRLDSSLLYAFSQQIFITLSAIFDLLEISSGTCIINLHRLKWETLAFPLMTQVSYLLFLTRSVIFLFVATPRLGVVSNGPSIQSTPEAPYLKPAGHSSPFSAY